MLQYCWHLSLHYLDWTYRLFILLARGLRYSREDDCTQLTWQPASAWNNVKPGDFSAKCKLVREMLSLCSSENVRNGYWYYMICMANGSRCIAIGQNCGDS